MIKYVKKAGATFPGENDRVFEVLAQDGSFYWLKEPGSSTPVTRDKAQYSPVELDPEPGDIWTSGVIDYRIIGVDHKRKIYHLVMVYEWYDGEYPIPQDGVQTWPAPCLTVLTRSLPEKSTRMRLKERP